MGKIARQLTLDGLIAEHVQPRMSVGLGGLHFHNTPMALVREIIRQEIVLSLLIPPLDGSINADQLIGAGLVEELRFAYVGGEIFGLAGRFRAAAEAGTIRLRDCEEAGFALALRAGATGLPLAVLPLGFMPVGGDIPAVLTVNAIDYQSIVDPFSGESAVVVRAIAPDVALIHCQLIDSRGNCGFLGAPFLDLDMARAARVCLVQAERQVELLPADCRAYLPGYVVDAYCVLEGGAHPAASHGCYGYDREHIEAYFAAAQTAAGFEQYRVEIIAANEAAYRRAVVIDARLEILAQPRP